MQAIRSILVVLDLSQPEGLALKRAKLIAGVTQSHLHLLVCDKKHDHSAYLDDLQKSLQAEGYSVTTQQLCLNTLHETIIAALQEEACGLVIKQHVPENPLKKAILTPDDWKILRYTPCPVLIVKTDTPWTEGTILAAIDVGNSDAKHRTLNTSIVANAAEIARVAKADLHLLSAHPSPMLSAADPTFQLSETIHARYLEQCKSYAEQFDVSDAQIHVEEGPADVLIPHIASKLNAGVVLLGTVARTGLSGALIGNTAEVVLDMLECDVAVLKPDDVLDHLESVVEQH